MPNPFSIDVGNPLQGLGAMANAYGRKVEKDELEEKQLLQQEQAQAMQEEIGGLLERGDIMEMSKYMAANPQLSKGIENAYNFKSDATKANKSETALKILSGADPYQAIRERAEMVKAQGGDPSHGLADLERSPEELKQMSAVWLANSGTPEQKKAAVDFGMIGGKGGSGAKVGAQEILEDGTVIQSTGSGIKVFNPQGELVKGQDAADAIRVGRAEKVSNLRKGAGGKRTAALEAENELKGEVEAGIISQKEAAKASIKAFDKIEAINEKIGLYDEGIALIDAGAGSGQIEKMFPSFKAASIKLDNLANRLGLDVVSNTTFGALSAGELAMAMSTAMPVGLDDDDLRDWMVEKKEAQEKLADYLESAAIYLGTPGNTKVGWLKKKKLEKKQRAQTQQQGKAPQAALDFLQANPQAAEQFKSKFGFLPEGF